MNDPQIKKIKKKKKTKNLIINTSYCARVRCRPLGQGGEAVGAVAAAVFAAEAASQKVPPGEDEEAVRVDIVIDVFDWSGVGTVIRGGADDGVFGAGGGREFADLFDDRRLKALWAEAIGPGFGPDDRREFAAPAIHAGRIGPAPKTLTADGTSLVCHYRSLAKRS